MLGLVIGALLLAAGLALALDRRTAPGIRVAGVLLAVAGGIVLLVALPGVSDGA